MLSEYHVPKQSATAKLLLTHIVTNHYEII